MALKDQTQVIEALRTAKTALKSREAANQERMIAFIDAKIVKNQKSLEVLRAAHNQCIESLKTDVIKQKSGVDLSALFD